MRGVERTRRWLFGVGVGLPLASAALLVLSRVPEWARDETAALSIFAGVFGLAVVAAHTRARAALLPALVVLLAAVPTVGWLVAGVEPGVVEAAIVGLALGLAALTRRFRS